MAESSALVPVEFHGATLTVTTINGAPFVVLRQIVEALGLDWQGQHARIKRHPVLSTCVSVTKMQMPGDDQSREVFMLPLDKLNGWLFGVTVSRVRPELRERLTQYQAECFDVLARHFGVKHPVSALPLSETPMSTKPEPAPAMPFSLDTLLAFITSGMIDHTALLRIANESGMALFQDVTNTKDAPWGEAVAAQINADLPQADLRVIVNKAAMELWKRSLNPKTTRIAPQRAQFTTV
ncbi:MAG: phage antirepressor N-terminal domain-containing protein [Rhodoferax sp.]